MYKCESCNCSAPKGQPRKTVVRVKRMKNYPPRATPVKNGRAMGKIVNRPNVYFEDGDKKLDFPPDPGGRGWEIAREVQLCPSCFEKANS